MARRAVQGYTEKTYYENTKFMGVLMSDDPLQEGFFRHLVNFNIADTGLSLRPRKGFLTTGLRKTNAEQSLITLSQDTILFREHALQRHVLYDFKSNKAYTADISGFNIDDTHLIPVASTDVVVDWSQVITFLLTNFPQVKTWYDEVLAVYMSDAGETGTPSVTTVSAARATVQSYFLQHIAIKKETQINYAYDLYGIRKHLIQIVLEDDDATDESNAEQYPVYVPHGTHVIGEKVLYQGEPYEYAVNITIGIFDEGAEYFTDDYVEYDGDLYQFNAPLSVAQSWLDADVRLASPAMDGHISAVTDVMSGVSITPRNLLLTFYYRKDAVTTVTPALSANTLMFEILDYNTHPTYDPTRRNIASSVTIIPDPLQQIHTSASRPDGHLNEAGILYAQDSSQRYLTQYAERNKNYTLFPHFSLNPAAYDNNDDATAKWAYRVDIVSMHHHTDATVQEFDSIIKGAWLDLEQALAGETPNYIFPLDDSIDLDNADMTLRHYKSARYIISVVPEDLTGTTTTNIPSGVYTDIYTITGYNVVTNASAIKAKHDEWKALIDTVYDRKSLIDAVYAFRGKARFFVKDLHSSDTVFTTHGVAYASTAPASVQAEINRANGQTYNDAFYDVDELVEAIESGYFSTADLAFRLFPLAFSDTFQNLNGGAAYTRYWFPSLEYLATDGVGDTWNGSEVQSSQLFENHPALCNRYDGYNDLQLGARFFAELPDGNSGVCISTETAHTEVEALLGHADVFDLGYSFIVYLRSYLPADLEEKTFKEYQTLKTIWAATSYTSVGTYTVTDPRDLTYIPEVQVFDPEKIQNATNQILYQDVYLVTWVDNLVYISEQGQFNYYKQENKKEYSERVVKVLEFKNILLVFTTQHLYALYLEIVEEPGQDGKGNPVTVQKMVWATQRVLYNIRTNERYKDVIQVFNEFVLFYSDDGQLFMIKPNTMINSDTRFSIKYFNQSANDVLLNYDEYINERLFNYNKEDRISKDDVEIRALLSVNYIRIFYNVSGLITYILEYDVINNRYLVYDTISFTEIDDKLFVESGELYLSVHNQKLYFTLPYRANNVRDNHVDMSIIDNFKKYGISTYIDTGNLNLNNHLKKRFRDLHVLFKNLSTSKVLFNVETMLDDMVAKPFYDRQLEVRDIGGVSYYVTVAKTDNNDLIDLVGDLQIADNAPDAVKYSIGTDDNIILDFTDYASSKLLTYRTTIMGKGKVLRLKMQFISKGDYKIQGFGVVYKERRV